MKHGITTLADFVHVASIPESHKMALNRTVLSRFPVPAPLIAVSALLILPRMSATLLAPVLRVLPMNPALCFAGGSVLGEVFLHGVKERLHGHSGDNGHEGGFGYAEAVLLGVCGFFGVGRLLQAFVAGRARAAAKAGKGKKEKKQAEKPKTEVETPARTLRKRRGKAEEAEAEKEAEERKEHDRDHDHSHDHSSSSHDHSHDHSHSHDHAPTSPALTLHLLTTALHAALDALSLALPFFLNPSNPPWSALVAVLLHELPHRLTSVLIASKMGGSEKNVSRWASAGVIAGFGLGFLLVHLGTALDPEILEGFAAGAMLYVGMIGVLGEVGGHAHGAEGENGVTWGAVLGELVGLGLGVWSVGLGGHQH